MFSIGHDGVILPHHHRVCSLGRMFPGIDEPVLDDVSEVVLSAAASVLEFVWVVSANTMLVKDAAVMYYLTSNMQYHQLRLAMLVRIVTTFNREEDFIMPDWKHVSEGDKKHLARHIVDAKMELGAELRTWDTELAESYWKDCLKVPHHLSSKKDSEKRKQMCLYMKDKLCIDELRNSIDKKDDDRRLARSKALITLTVNKPWPSEYMIHTAYQQDRLLYSNRRQAWVREDYQTINESRYLHCLTDMKIVSDYLKSHFER